MKPLEGSFAQNAIEHGVAGIWVEGCRVPYSSPADIKRRRREENGRQSDWNGSVARGEGRSLNTCRILKHNPITELGRFPANIIHDSSEEAIMSFPTERGFGSSARFFQSCESDE